MKPNVGPTESIYRISLGAAALVAALTLIKSKRLAALLGAVGATGIQTGLSRYCPASQALGIDNAPGLRDSPLDRMSLSVH